VNWDEIGNEALGLPSGVRRLLAHRLLDSIARPAKWLEPWSYADDPIWNLGRNPVSCDVSDGSTKHERYIYGDPHGLLREASGGAATPQKHDAGSTSMASQIPPATLEGWYALHQMFALDWARLRADGAAGLFAAAAESLFAELAASVGEGEGWSEPVRLVGAGGADFMFVHFRPTLDALAEVQRRVSSSPLSPYVALVYEYLSVTEAGLYHATADAAKAAEPGSEAFKQHIAEAQAAEAASAHVRSRLYPEVPEGMRYVSFYPMTKRRAEGQNWYALDVRERSRLMREHGMTGRRYAGRVFQVITGSVGLDDWEWGVTLFARDPLEFKRIVTEMRYDEASAVYGEFGRFFTGIRFAPRQWGLQLGVAA